MSGRPPVRVAEEFAMHGRETAAQRARVASAGDLRERLDTGQLLAGAPGTVLRQVKSIGQELGAGMPRMHVW